MRFKNDWTGKDIGSGKSLREKKGGIMWGMIDYESHQNLLPL